MSPLVGRGMNDQNLLIWYKVEIASNFKEEIASNLKEVIVSNLKEEIAFDLKVFHYLCYVREKRDMVHFKQSRRWIKKK